MPASATMAWMSRSNWDASSSSGNRVSPKMANGRSEASANYDIAAQVVPGALAPEGDQPPDARRLRVHDPAQRE